MYQLQVGLYRRSNCLFRTPSHVYFLTVFFEYLGTGTGGHQRDGADLTSRANPGPILFEFRAVFGKNWPK